MSSKPGNDLYILARPSVSAGRPARGGLVQRMLSHECGVRHAGMGFTMVELLVTITIAGILMAIALPMINTPHTASEANSLLGAVQFARSVSVKQGQNVIVCPTSNAAANPATCSTGAAWSAGWIVVVPASQSCTVTASTGSSNGDQVLQVFPALNSGDTATFTAASGNSNTAFCYTRSGFSYSGYNGTVQIDTNPVKQNLRRCVVVSGVGHAQVLSYGQSDVNSVVCP